MQQIEKINKLALAKKREEIINLIYKIEDEQLLDNIQELIYKATNGCHTENQIISQLQQKYQIPVIRGTPEENIGSFKFQEKQFQFRLEKFYLDLKSFRLAFEIDENFHIGAVHDPSRELVREFQYFKNRKDQNTVLVRYGFRARRKDQPLEKFAETRTEVVHLLINNLAHKGSFYQALKEKFNNGINHLVCFYGYPPDNRHVSEHTIFNDKISPGNVVELDDMTKSTREGKLRIYLFGYSIDKVNEVYKENYSYSEIKSSPSKE
jgi:hypothetical protein